MAIFLTENSKVIVQGMTGSEGMKHTQRMLDSGTDIVGGVNPRKAGETVEFTGGTSVPVFSWTRPGLLDAAQALSSITFCCELESPRMRVSKKECVPEPACAR